MVWWRIDKAVAQRAKPGGEHVLENEASGVDGADHDRGQRCPATSCRDQDYSKHDQ